MPRIEQDIVIDASSTRIFDVMTVQMDRTQDGRSSYGYTLMGIRIKGEYVVVDVQDERYLLLRTTSGIEALIELALQPEATKTRLKLTADYSLPGTLLGSSTHRPALEQQIEGDVAAALGHLKAMAEGGNLAESPG